MTKQFCWWMDEACEEVIGTHVLLSCPRLHRICDPRQVLFLLFNNA